MLPLLRAAAEGETRVPDISDRLADVFKLSADEREQMLPSGRQRLIHNRVHWAKFYMTKAGLLKTTRRGWFTISEEGQSLLATQPERIDVNFLMNIPAFEDFYAGAKTVDSQATQENSESAKENSNTVSYITPEEQIETSYSAMQSAIRDELIERILQNNPSFFENVIIALLVAMGYGGSHKDAARQLGKTGDGGVDGVINEDALGLDRVYVQAKRYARGTGVGRPEVQGFVGSLVGLGAMKGVFVTTGTFSKPAIDFVSRLSQRVILIDGCRLTELMVEHNVGVRVSRIIEFKKIDEDFFLEDG
jgi:restriction system protein